MDTLHYDDLDIVGFAGIRERILVMDSRVFGYRRREECWEGVGPLTYLAHAYFKAGGSTGLHHHDSVDILSIVTRGRIMHKGSAGAEVTLSAGDIMLQRSGSAGFSHDEINPDDDIAGMVQVWLLPASQKDADSSLTVFSPASGETLLYHSDGYDIVVAALEAGDSICAAEAALLYVYEGALFSDGMQLPRGTLMRGTGGILQSVSAARLLICRVK